MLVKASVYFGSVCEMRAFDAGSGGGGGGGGRQRRRSKRLVTAAADATRDLFVRPRGMSARRPRLRHRATVRARVITNVKCYRTQPSAARRRRRPHSAAPLFIIIKPDI